MSIIYLYPDDKSSPLCNIVPDLHHQSVRCRSPEQTQSLPRDDDGPGRSQPPCGRGASRSSQPLLPKYDFQLEDVLNYNLPGMFPES